MRYYFTLILLMTFSLSFAQGDISLHVEVSADTILMENAFRLQFVMKNGPRKGFQVPEINDFQLLQGPSRSSQMSYVNGVQSSEESYTFYFKPNQAGSFKVPSFEVEIEGENYKSNSPAITVIPNPEGLHQDPNTGRIEGRPLQQKKVSKRKRFKI